MSASPPSQNVRSGKAFEEDENESQELEYGEWVAEQCLISN